VSAASILETEDYEPKYEKKYAPKYESEYEEPKYEDKYSEKKHYKKKHSYGKEKVSVKLYEKFRSHLRPQPGNVNTFQFT
jgi:hypothetical protein